MEYLLDLAPLIAVIVALFGLLYWSMRRKEGKAEREHAGALARFAGTLGGTVAGPGGARPWSAELLAPLRDETDGLLNRMGIGSRRRYGTALDFPRDGWSVRVSEASVKKATSTSTTTVYEHRIEVAASGLPPMKISRRVYSSKDSQGGEPAREVPVTVAAEGGQWHRVAFPPGPLDARFAAFAGDPAAAARALRPEAVEHLLARAHSLPFTLHVEAGLVFGTVPGRIDPDHVLDAVDAVLDLLDRMGAAPAHPPVTA
ncbi:hypothetical protein [Saccharothrix variisporea]|uniref:Uncharacterized protein n=1 Tax=Saccharothrix variisporea TaxID=543527 RepID=A0A495XAG4_9PSEU|nr:hypothetical protein [Saccharothrix variisporea]RKT70085.1 hypothetical protein DFJ66_3326 [Saccharothrix variisporea]